MSATLDDLLANELGKTETTADTTATTETTTVTETEGAASTTETKVEEAAKGENELVESTEVTATPDEVETTSTEQTTTTAPKTFEEELKLRLGLQSEDDVKNLQSELKQFKERNTLGTLLDKLTAQGVAPETVIAYHKMDLDAKNPDGTFKVADRSALDLQMQLKYPTLSTEQREALLDEKYGDENNPAGQAKQTIDAAEARKALMEEKGKVLDVSKPAESFESKQAKDLQTSELARVKTWQETPKVKEIVSGLNKIGQKLQIPDFGDTNMPVGKSFDFTHKINPADAAKVEESLRVAAIQQGFDVNDTQAIESLRVMGENIYRLQNQDKIINDVAKQVASYMRKQENIKYHGGKQTGLTTSIDATKGADRYEATIMNM